MSKRIELRFSNEEGRNVTVSVDAPVDPADPQAVEAAMDAVLNEDVFFSTGGSITAKRDARIVERTVDTVFEL
ncbi:DUF2922 domain-containing protein [Salibacterium halotolerans]|uniref:DUF2922 domain-containing protein n=1 Tax=Salibacterium halotolerans TaxID=1884432 RepID=A0A1I5S9L7_9BACI|nr:DUF2922 domain-containing protein [Salibacterium halotolerans]SFP67498.1 Protein of unknown function [Salibacterium halotolerans]